MSSSSSAGNICPTCRRNPGTVMSTLSSELICSRCNTNYAEFLLSIRSPPRSPQSPIRMSTSLPEPLSLFSGISSANQFGPHNSRNLSNVLDQQQPPVYGYRQRWNMMLDAEALQEVRQVQHSSPNWSGNPPAARWAIQDLPDVEVDAEISKVICTVCSSGLNHGEKVTQLPCDHLYHRDCIITWLNTRNTCPVCRLELPTDDEAYESQMDYVYLVSSIRSGNLGGSGSENPGVSGSESPLEPGVSSPENLVVSGSESPGVSGSDNLPAVSDDENIGGSSSGSGFGA